MKARGWMTILAVALLGLVGSAAHAQITGANPAPMKVLIKFNKDVDAWDVATRIASATGMELLGISSSTRAAAYIVTNETNYATGRVAAANQDFVIAQFPGTVATYNYGQNIVTPADLQQPPIKDSDRRRPEPPPVKDSDRRGGYGYRPRGPRFSETDRQAAMDWFDKNRAMSSRIEVGMVLDQDLRGRADPAPNALVRRLAPAPVGTRYLIIAGTLVLVDSRDFVQDIIRFDETR